MRTRSGVTLIEVLVMISIVGILAALCLWGVQAHVRQPIAPSVPTICANWHWRPRPTTAALGSYPGGQYLHPFSKAAFSGRQVNNASWLVMLLPQVGQQALYNEVNFSFMWGRPPWRGLEKFRQSECDGPRNGPWPVCVPSRPQPPNRSN